MLFTAEAHPRLARGAITLTFRAWQRAQVKAGGRYRIGGTDIVLLVDDVRQVRVGDITDEDARRAGADSPEAIAARLGASRRGRYHRSEGREVHPDSLVWRVEFHRATPDTEPALADRDDLGPDDVADITRRLDRLDAASSHGAWTRHALGLIAEEPGVVSTTLAEKTGRERQAFKADVRKLKRLGLTESLDVGYRLSPRGQAYLAAQPRSRPRR